LAAVLILSAAALLWLRRSKAGGAGGDVLDSVAVLPFVNASPDPETEYLSDGITEAIINSLSSLPNLRVSPRSRVFRYKGKEDDPQKIGRELNVRAVVSGKVLPRDGRLSIQADLVDIGKGSQIWGDQYDRPMSEILAIQEEIARDVSEKLRVQMSGAEVEKLKKRPTGNIEAYQTYLKGRHAWEKRGARDLQQAIEYFQKAIELDPSFALAYSGLAGVYAVLPSYNQMAPADASERVKAAARKALEIDEGIAPAHAALGLALSHYDREFAPAEAAYRRAITLDPNDATAHHWYAMLLSATERSEEAIAEIEKARELDPFSMVIRSNVVRVLAQARRHDEALERARQMAREFPDFAAGHFFLGLALEQKGQLPDAAASFLKATSLAAAPLQKLFYRAHSEALRGRMGDLRATIREVETIAETRYVSSTSMAVLYLLAGDKDQGLALLERGLEEGDYAAIFLPVDRQFDELRSDPRFAEILRRSRMPVRR
jgi:TolB-like protein/tetratricopeptide (TPR) repeat protein